MPCLVFCVFPSVSTSGMTSGIGPAENLYRCGKTVAAVAMEVLSSFWSCNVTLLKSFYYYARTAVGNILGPCLVSLQYLRSRDRTVCS